VLVAIKLRRSTDHSLLLLLNFLVRLHEGFGCVHVSEYKFGARLRRGKLEPLFGILVVVQVLTPVYQLLNLLVELLLIFDLHELRVLKWIVSFDLVVTIRI